MYPTLPKFEGRPLFKPTLSVALALCALLGAGSAQRCFAGSSSQAAFASPEEAGRALAWLRGQDYLSPAVVQELAPDVLRHRLGLTYEAEAQEITPDAVISEVVSTTPVPPA